jgi:tetratricopeptide (TPR) repeat protein
VGAVISIEGLSLTNRALNALNSIVMYGANLLWPVRLNYFYAFDEAPPARTFFLGALVAIISTAALWRRRRKTYLLTGWLWYLVMLLPVLGLVQVGSAARADRYTYLPSIGLLIALVWLVSEIVPRTKICRAWLAAFGVAVLVALALATRHQLPAWENGITLCEHSIAIEPRDARSHFNLGCTLEKLGDRDGAIPHFTAAIALSPAYTKAHNNLGSALASKGDFAGAEPHFRAALQLNPDHTAARLNLVRSLASQGKLAEALEQLAATQQKDKSSPAVLALTGDVLLGLGRLRDAAPYLAQLAQANPSPELHAKIATLYIQINEPKNAVVHYRAALTLKPDWEQVLNNLAWTLATNPDVAVRNGAEAVRLAGRACELTQNQQPGFLATLAAAQAEAGQFDQAIATAQKALDLANQSGNAQLAASIAPLHATFSNRQPYHAPPAPPAAANPK